MSSKGTIRKNKKHWIQDAVKHPGSFTKTAERDHKSVNAEAEKDKHKSGKTGARARLALTFESMRHRK